MKCIYVCLPIATLLPMDTNHWMLCFESLYHDTLTMILFSYVDAIETRQVDIREDSRPVFWEQQ